MEHTRLTEIKVGVFVVLAMILTLGFLIVLGGDKFLLQKHAHLFLKANDAMGLSIGSMVQLAGVPVGHVDKISFDSQENKLSIRLMIENEYMRRITQGSTISILTQGALGDKYLSIQPGPFSSEPMKDGDQLQAEVDLDLLSTLGKSGNRVEKIFDILDNIEKLVRGLNERNMPQNLSETVKNLRHSTLSMDELLTSLKGTDPRSNKLKKTLDHLASILEKVDSGQGTLGGLINDPTVHEDLKSLVGGAKRSKLLKYLIRQTIQKSEESTASPK